MKEVNIDLPTFLYTLVGTILQALTVLCSRRGFVPLGFARRNDGTVASTSEELQRAEGKTASNRGEGGDQAYGHGTAQI